MNKAILIGRLTREPELKSTQSGVSVCTFTIAVDRRFKQDGQPAADFIPIVVWRAQADNCAKYLGKGSQVGIVGTMQNRSYDDRNGNKRVITEVIAEEVQFIGSKVNEPENAVKMDENEYISKTTEVTTDDDIPF